MFTCSKLLMGFSSAYRNHNSKTDCFLLHGYSRDFYIEFGANHLDKSGFVVDYGSPALKEFKRWLEENFDHTTVLQADDPLARHFKALERDGHCKLTLVHCVSAEGWAMYIAKMLQELIHESTDGRAWVNFVECRENYKNASRYYENKEVSVVDPVTLGLETSYMATDCLTFNDLLEVIEEMQND